MLVIRKPQLDTLGKAPRLEVEARLVKHCFTYYPRECADLGEARIRKFVRHGTDVACAHGYESERAIALFLSLMFSMGSEFHRDPRYPWCKGTLERTRLADRAGSIDRLFERAMRELDRLAGADNEHLVRAMIRAREYDFASVPLQRTSPGFVADISGILRSIDPVRSAAMGKTALATIVRDAIAESSQFGLTDEDGILTYVALVFMLGVGVATDLLYPWVGTILRDASLDAPGARGRQLLRAARSYLDESLRHG